MPSSHTLDSLYKYVDIEATMNILSTGRLRWSSPLIFNDPFDTPNKLPFRFTLEEFYSCFFKKMHSVIEDDSLLFKSKNRLLSLFALHPLKTRYKILQELENEFKLTDNEIIEITSGWDNIESEWKSIIPTMRILCLSQNKDIAPMWHHYAGQNTGVVLEFAPNAVADSAFLMAKEVEYNDDPPLIGQPDVWMDWTLGIGDLTPQDLFTQHAHLKKSSWSNEKEWRIVSFETNDISNLFSYYEFDSHVLKGIFLGYKCKAEDKLAIYNICQEKYTHVALYNVVLDENNRVYQYEKYNPK